MMIHKLKALGPILLAPRAAGAFAVSSTSASSETPNLTAGEKTAGKEQKVTLEGNGTDETFTGLGQTITCEITVWGPNEQTVPAAQFTVKPYHRVCSVPGSETIGDVTVVTNNCDFQFNIGSTAEAGGKPIPDTYTGLLDFECENGAEGFEIKLWFKGKHDDVDAPSCVYKIAPQTGAGLTIKVDTTGAHDDLLVSGKIGKLTAERTVGGILCPKGTTEAFYNFPAGGATIYARDGGGKELDAWID